MNKILRSSICTILFLMFITLYAVSQTTQIQYLSGTGKDNTVEWDFFCTKGSNSGQWTTIAVPSCWEQEGLGNYNYGKDKNIDKADEQGLYKLSFSVPVEWSNKSTFIVFEGSMTDTEVKINGQPMASTRGMCAAAFRNPSMMWR